ncbi:hypothetical protein HDU87_002331 [Geranomyces variabilis]|uniref:Large ribosomal subunit protein mL40 n=1 Tax=Geranomyces variabilis TaxID=109894 RepID=A0AAD5XNX2_9FUNG|nr:hypothetical protein HDU87_002331 [Geranomyces variabilis]
MPSPSLACAAARTTAIRSSRSLSTSATFPCSFSSSARVSHHRCTALRPSPLSTRTFTTTAIAHARPGLTSQANKKVKDVLSSDKRYSLIREILYDKDVPTTPAKPVQQLTAQSVSNPIATRREHDAKVDAIERAWAIEKQKEAAAKMEELRGMYESMRLAMEELERTDSRLFEAAKVGADREKVVVFPRRLRVPTETPPLDGWDYEMKAGNKPETE